MAGAKAQCLAIPAARLKSGPDTKHRSALRGDCGFFSLVLTQAYLVAYCGDCMS